MKLVIENNVGETRAAIFEGKKCAEVFVSRWSEAGRAFPGDVFSGRVRSVDASLSAAFIDIGVEPQGFLNFSLAEGAPRFREGQMVRVKVSREAEEAKGPILSYVEMSEAEAPIREQGGDLVSRIKARYENPYIEEAEIAEFDAVLDIDVALKGGGSISIEPTRAVTAIDVDTGIGGNKKTVSLAAAKEAARQVRLRGIGGLILIDFPNFRKKKDRDDVWQTLVDNFNNDPQDNIKIAPMSRFGTVEISRPKTSRSIMQMCTDRYGLPSAESTALLGLRQLEREGRISGGAQLTLGLPKPAYAWLMSDKINWRDALTERLGARFAIEVSESLYVSKDR